MCLKLLTLIHSLPTELSTLVKCVLAPAQRQKAHDGCDLQCPVSQILVGLLRKRNTGDGGQSIPKAEDLAAAIAAPLSLFVVCPLALTLCVCMCNCPAHTQLLAHTSHDLSS